jgi:hypothetical protein
MSEFVDPEKLAGACGEQSQRDGAIVAWHDVPGTAPPYQSRPVGYGLIRARVRTDSMTGVTKFRIPAYEIGRSEGRKRHSRSLDPTSCRIDRRSRQPVTTFGDAAAFLRR